MLIWFTNAYTFSYAHLLSVFCEKMFFFCTSEMAIKCTFLHLQSWNLVQMKANKILFILAFFNVIWHTVQKLWPFDWITSFHAEMKYFELTIPTTGIWEAPASLEFLGYAEINEWKLVLGFQNVIENLLLLGEIRERCFFLNLNGVHYRQQLSFWNWILFFVKRNTSHKSCHSFLNSSLWAPKVCKNQAWVLNNLGYKLNRKISTSPCN